MWGQARLRASHSNLAGFSLSNRKKKWVQVACSDFTMKAYLLHDIGITRHFMFSKPHCGETGPGSEHEAYDVLLWQNKSSLLRPDYPSAAMSATGVSQPSQQPPSWSFPLRWQVNASFFLPGIHGECWWVSLAEVKLLGKSQHGVEHWECRLHSQKLSSISKVVFLDIWEYSTCS